MQGLQRSLFQILNSSWAETFPNPQPAKLHEFSSLFQPQRSGSTLATELSLPRRTQHVSKSSEILEEQASGLSENPA